MNTTASRIERITSAHPGIKAEDVSLILCYYYKYEWSLAGATLDEVRNTLDCITRSIVDGDRMHIEFLIGQIKLRKKCEDGNLL
jgi:hypothetical protein